MYVFSHLCITLNLQIPFETPVGVRKLAKGHSEVAFKGGEMECKECKGLKGNRGTGRLK